MFRYLICFVSTVVTIIPVLWILAWAGVLIWIGKSVGYFTDKDNEYSKITFIHGFLLAYAVDQLQNNIWGGRADQTISSRTKEALDTGKPLWFVPPFAELVDFLAIVVAGDKGHINKSLTDVSGDKQFIVWDKKSKPDV